MSCFLFFLFSSSIISVESILTLFSMVTALNSLIHSIAYSSSTIHPFCLTLQHGEAIDFNTNIEKSILSSFSITHFRFQAKSPQCSNNHLPTLSLSLSFSLFLSLSLSLSLSLWHWLAVRVFANGPRDLGSIPGRVIPKFKKWYLMPPCVCQHYKVKMKGKVEQSMERSSALPYTLVY